jgi:hexosaminidase
MRLVPLSLLALCLPVLGLVPQPTSVKTAEGGLKLTSNTRIFFETRKTDRPIENSLQPLAEVLAEEIEIVTGLKPKVVARQANAAPGPGDISLQFSKLSGAFAASEEDEVQSYVLGVSDKIVIASEYTKGVAYGTTTLIQSIVEVPAGGYGVRKMTVTDSPAAAYRGVMLDLARQPSSLEMVKEIVRLARQYKIRYLHLHLTDDQNFTFPFAGVTDKIEGNFTYPREALVELGKYADARGVTIIPEFDLPGHSSKLRASGYLNPSSNDRDVAHPDNFAKIQAIIDEMLAVFPSSPYFHIGGDESSAGDALIPFLAAMNKHVRGKPAGEKKRLLVWEGFHGAPTKEIPATGEDRVVVFSWESSYNPPWNLLEAGYEIINASWKPMYIVGSGSSNRGPHVVQRMWSPEILHTWDKNTFMHWEPGRPVFEDAGPKDDVKDDQRWNAKSINKESLVLGGQIITWEQNERTIVRDMLPRLPVAADRLWNPIATEDYAAFEKRLSAARERVLSIVHPVEILPQGPTPAPPYAADYRYYAGENVEVTLRNRTKIEGTIRYNLGNGSNEFDSSGFELVPLTTSSSNAYTAPFASPKGAFGIRAQLFRKDGTPIEGSDMQFFSNRENKIELTEFEVPAKPLKETPDFATFPPAKIKRKVLVPELRGPYVLDEAKGQMFLADLQTPDRGKHTFRLQVSDGHGTLFLDLNRNGKWEPAERILANATDDKPTDIEVDLESGPYRLRVDHASGAIGGMCWLRISGPGIDGFKNISAYLAPPEGQPGNPAGGKRPPLKR